MSAGQRLPRQAGLALANRIIHLIQPYCDRVEIAGSLRRGKPDVGDIEIVAIPKLTKGLFGDEKVRESKSIEIVLRNAGYRLVKNGNRFKQIELDECKCDLFFTTPDRWGLIFAIRTGPAEFSHKLVTQRRYGGHLPSDLFVTDGLIWRGGEVIPTPEEVDVFRVLGMNYVSPEMRGIFS